MAVNKSIIAIVVVVVALIAGYFALMQGNYMSQEMPQEAVEETEAATTAMQEEQGSEATTVKVELYEWGISMSTNEVKAGTKVVFEVVNRGSYIHAFEVENRQLGFSAGTKNLGPGESAKLEVTFTEPGEYVVYCPVGSHKELGMEDMLIVSE
ncbi:MAG: cupredoxin domain-containing protein [Desulfurococcales archaeon]|nr:cupredoxin domain-containing protein [Desulfurococcales archaeon]